MAAQEAGFDVIRLIDSAAARVVDWSHRTVAHRDDANLMVGVFDQGAGGLEVAIVETGQGCLAIESLRGNRALGGDHVDAMLKESILQRFRARNGPPNGLDALQTRVLRDIARSVKEQLSACGQARAHIPGFFETARGHYDLDDSIRREHLHELTADIRQEALDEFRNSATDAGMALEELDAVVLGGGSIRLTGMRRELEGAIGGAKRATSPPTGVAAGAAVFGGVLSGDVENLTLIDVVPTSLGIETLGGVMTRLVERTTCIPTSRAEVFSTVSDAQTKAEVLVLEGERTMASDNLPLGRVCFAGIPSAPRGVPQIEVGFHIDVRGVLSVSVREHGSGRCSEVVLDAAETLKSGPAERARGVRDGCELTPVE
jgi:molecular chaperone DnaK